MFYSAPFPWLLNPEALHQTIERRVREGKFGYARKTNKGYEEIRFKGPNFRVSDVEFSEHFVTVLQEKDVELTTSTESDDGEGDGEPGRREECPEPPSALQYRKCAWEGELPYQKRMQFYIKG